LFDKALLVGKKAKKGGQLAITVWAAKQWHWNQVMLRDECTAGISATC
jgi:hypothetical protein